MSIMDVFADYFMGIMASSFCILIIYFLRKKFFKFGVLSLKGLVFIYCLCILRALIPLELPFSVPVKCQLLMPITDLLFFMPILYRNIKIFGWQIVSCLYLTIFFLLIIRLLVYYNSASKAMKRTHGVVDKQATILLDKILHEDRRISSVKLLTSSDISSPLSIGLLNPAIILPANYKSLYSDRELYYILKHEYTHIKKHDSLKKLLLNIASCFIFWNPCMLLLKKDFIQSIELRCDNEVISGMSSSERKDYLSTMLTVLTCKTPTPNSTSSYEPALNFVSNESIYIKERFKIIETHSDALQKKANIMIPIMLFVVVLCSYTFILQPKYAPPIEDIIEGPDCYEIDMQSDYIIVSEDGSATMYLKNGTQLSATAEDIAFFNKYNGKVIYKKN
ncbi:M56 family metallopeptidase [Butyrivibrio sp. XPD2002]|uniref:M56 family metallopeptidase n=1 Tax=Butyrivibrio sp. XPD2002 TaxID=1280665 RepID=UPI0003FA037C|nr:M56 family metallopeptidase [Butyrivibrio sp. XPD2002]